MTTGSILVTPTSGTLASPSGSTIRADINRPDAATLAAARALPHIRPTSLLVLLSYARARKKSHNHE